MKRKFSKADFIEEEGRTEIYHWSERRERKYKGYRKSIHEFRIFAFNTNLLRSFLENFNFMVVLQMALAGLVTYACRSLNIVYNVHVSLFISPIVFPLAFSINTDFQRREKVLEDLANFKSSAMMWLFCIRDWREPCCFDDNFMKAVGNKVKSLLFHLREYLLTDKLERRKFIARVIYEDMSDLNQINDKVRTSQLPANSPLVSRIIHFLNMICLSFERLRVIREYRSPRSIRSFTKVLIFVFPILLSPYYVYLGNSVNNNWSPYYISVMVAFVFGALQGVQDKLDDPFDGMSEDDIKLDTLDEWTFQSLVATVHRTYKIGRFQVSNTEERKPSMPPPLAVVEEIDGFRRKSAPYKERHRTQSTRSPLRSVHAMYSEDETSDDFELHPYAGVLHNIKGNTTILRGGHIKRRNISYDDLNSVHNSLTRDSVKSIHLNQVMYGGHSSIQKGVQNVPTNPVPLQSLFTLSNPEEISVTLQETPLTIANVPANLQLAKEESPKSGVASYLALQWNGSLSPTNSYHSIESNGSNKGRPLWNSPTEPLHVSANSQDGSTASVKAKNSRFFITNESICSNRPLLQTSTDSDFVTSSDDDGKQLARQKLEDNHILLNTKNQNHSLGSLNKSPFVVTGEKRFSKSKSENGLICRLKDEEIFI